jgi:hypothetical protein
MNRTLKEATVQRYHYGTHAQLKAHLHAFLIAYNFAKRLKTLRGLTPYEHICKAGFALNEMRDGRSSHRVWTRSMAERSYTRLSSRA